METVEQWDIFEISIKGNITHQPFNQTIKGEFTFCQNTQIVDGFYDGHQIFKVRFMPSFIGEYHYKIYGEGIESVEGTFKVTKASQNNHGPVRVASQYHFAYEDGTPYYCVGTTCYAWPVQNENIQKQTIETLKNSCFNKLRFCIFPKHYDYNLNEPILYPFEKGNQEGLDKEQVQKAFVFPPVENPNMNFNFYQYNVEYFKHLDQCLTQLKNLNIEADLILFHPYDRWGNNKMCQEADDAYLKYVIARFSSYRNVWWSLANEYDLMPQKSIADWERYASIIMEKDVYQHLRSIHNCMAFYDHHRPWITHCSLQRQDLYRHVEYTDEYQQKWQKPIVWDEIAYEGNINHGWGNISPQELVRRFWEGSLRGGYVGHSETYMHPDQILWWSHGGIMHGKSEPRLKFLLSILKQTPALGLKRIAGNFDELVATANTPFESGYKIYYYGFMRPSFREFNLEEKYEVEVIDTWEMTITSLGIKQGHIKVPLPAKEYMAIRLKRVDTQ